MTEMRTKPKVECKICQVTILATTANSTGELCMPCFKAANGGHTPKTLEYISTQGLEAIEERWRTFNEMRFPAELGGTEVAGVCVSTLVSTVAGCLSTGLSMGEDDAILDDDRISLLQSSLPALVTVIEILHGENKSYFFELLWMAKAILGACGKLKDDSISS